MREILFRGIRKDTHEWVYGFYGEYFNGKKNIPCISIVDTHAITGSLCYEVIPETVGQFTGLTDKNGKRIYEGDLLGDSAGFIHKVFFEDGCFMRKHGLRYSTLGTTHHIMEAVGNIHDNADLLK